METLNDYPFEVTNDVPSEPDRLFVPAQLESALEEVYNLDDVNVSKRFTRRVAEVERSTRTGPLTAKVSWKVFEDENATSGANGWMVICSALEDFREVTR